MILKVDHQNHDQQEYSKLKRGYFTTHNTAVTTGNIFGAFFFFLFKYAY